MLHSEHAVVLPFVQTDGRSNRDACCTNFMAAPNSTSTTAMPYFFARFWASKMGLFLLRAHEVAITASVLSNLHVRLGVGWAASCYYCVFQGQLIT